MSCKASFLSEHKSPLLFLFLLFLSSASSFSSPFTKPSFTSPSRLSAHSKKQIPVTSLAGFLGSGKTTLLQHLLSTTTSKIALIVNDVAQINIDSKLLSSTSGNVINLSNGCACCSLQGDLVSSISELVTLSQIRDEGEFDSIVIECSGVAEPQGIRSVFQEEEKYGMPTMKRVKLDTMVTVVDCSTFLDYLESQKEASEDETPELFSTAPPDPEKKNKFQEELDDLPPLLLEALMAGAPEPEPQENPGVSSLLISQIEVADILLMNKIDLASDETLEKIEEVLISLNPNAVILKSSYGNVKVEDLLNRMGGNGVAIAGIVDDHKELVAAVKGETHQEENNHADEHSHNTAHQKELSSTCEDPDCTDTSHSHAHAHASQESSACEDPDCTDTSHSHTHAHASQESSTCGDPNCTDTSHSHTHVHASHAHSFLKTFVYTTRKPFHPSRLSKLLMNLPVVRGLPSVEHEGEKSEIFKGLVRSKGFCWLASSDVGSMYWSHAGSSFEMQNLGRWWATLPQEEWPSEAIDNILSDFDSKTSPIVGDRRQEVVFIGNNVEPVVYQKTLDECLLTDEEYEEYKKIKDDEEKLKEKFGESGLEIKAMSY